jgi:uncharacterized membrane protein HdeD (DUF308 family)
LFLGIGALTILTGLALAVSPFLLRQSTGLVFGWLMIGAGGIQLAASYLGRRWAGGIVALMNGLLYVGIGITLIADESAVVGGVMLTAAFLMVAAGLSRLGIGALKPYSHREIHLFLGALGLVVGLMVGAAWYGGQLWAVGFILGIDVIVTGVSWLLFAVVLRRVRSGEARGTGAP